MLAEATALQIVNDLLTRPNADPNQMVAALDNIFTSGVRFASREEADELLGKLNGLAMDQKNTAVQYAALAVLERVREEKDEELPQGFPDDKSDLALTPDNDDDSDIFDAADQTTTRKRGLAAVLMAVAKTNCGPAAREHALEAYADSIEGRKLHCSEAETLDLIAANDPAPAVQAKANGILERFNMAQAHHAERHTVTPRKKAAEDTKG